MTHKPRLAVARPDGPHINLRATVTSLEEFSVPVGPEGEHQSIGAFIDDYFGGIASEGGLVTEFSLEVTPDTFAGMYGRAAAAVEAE